MKTRKLISVLLVLSMLISLVAVPVSAEDTITLQNPGFENGMTSWTETFIGTKPSSSYTSWYSTDANHSGSRAYKYWMPSDTSYTITQTLASVPAGTYTLSGYAMASSDTSEKSVVSAYFDGLTATESVSASGQTWGSWGQFSATFVVEEDMTNVAVGFLVDCPAKGWGRVDDLTLTYTEPSAEPEPPAEVAVELTDSDFEDSSFSAWKTTFVTTAPSSYNSWYDTDSVHSGSGAYKYWMPSAAEYTVTQTLASVPAGTYTLSGYAMASSDTSEKSVVSAYFGGLTATESVSASGQTWGSWGQFSATFVVEEDMTNVAVGFYVNSPAKGWGRVDDLSLVYVPASKDSEPVEMTELILPNGDFEQGNANNWMLSGYSKVEDNEWDTQNTSYRLNLWLSNDAEATGSAAYTVKLSAGTYYFTFAMAGGINDGPTPADSGLNYTISYGTTTVTGDSAVSVNGWGKWETHQTKEFTLTEETDVTFSISGTQPAKFFGDLDNLKLFGTGALAEKYPDKVESDIYVPYVRGSGGDFMRGMDISSLLSILNSGATFKDYEGNVLDGPGFMELLKESGANWVRIRVWNDPFDATGNGYGGGNCDIEAAKTMGKWATEAGLRVLIDFHYSDFWADPGKQQVPKAWAGYTVEEKAAAITQFTTDSLNTLINAGVDVGMVQIGNETNSSLCGESNWTNICTLFNAGASAVRAVDADILVAIHFTNPEKSNYASRAKTLADNNVDYDIFASSYYPYWHGTLDNLTDQLKAVANTYGKQVIVAETSWAYTLEDGDGWSNTVSASSGYEGLGYSFSVHGQAAEIAAVAQAVINVGEKGIGMFYWEPAWIPVQIYDGQEETLNENKALWEKYGSGWASSYAKEYDANDAGKWYGGSAVDNQALFHFDGTPLESLKTYLYMQTGTTGFDVIITEVETADQQYTVGDTLALPEKLTVSYNFGDDADLPVTWNEADVAAINMGIPGQYTVKGTLEGDVAVTCTVTVRPANLLQNPGMESSEMSMYEISQAYAKRASDDPHSGSHSLHFYNSGIADFTAQQTLILAPGHYEFSIFGQGGDMGEDAVTYAYVKIGDTVLTESFSLTGWAVWTNPTVCFDLTEETSVTVGVSVTSSQNGAWGTFDDWYLCVATDPVHTPAEDDGDCTTAIRCTVCGEETTAAQENHAYDASGKCGLCSAQAVAKIGNTCYLTFADAAANAAEGDTIELLKDVTIAESETVTFAALAKLELGNFILTNNGTVKIGEKDGIIFENVLYYDGGDAAEKGLYLHDSTPATYYTAGNGYAIFLPGDGVNPGELFLHNATLMGKDHQMSGSSGDISNGIDYFYYTGFGVEENRDLIIHFSGDNVVKGRTGPDGSHGIVVHSGVLTLAGEEGATLTVSSGNARNVSTGIETRGLYVTGGTVYASAGEDIEGAAVAVSGSESKIIVSEGAALYAQGHPIGFGVSSKIEGNANGTALNYTVDPDALTYSFEFTTYGDAVLAYNLTVYNPYADTEGTDEYTAIVTFSVPAGCTLAIPSGVVLDLSALSLEDISLVGLVNNSGTIIFPATMTPADIPDTVTGSRILIGEKLYQWDLMHEYWVCADAPCVPEEDDGDCTTPVKCINCEHHTVYANSEHTYSIEVEGTRVDATCMSDGTVTMKCIFCTHTKDIPLEIDPNNHTGNNHLEYYQQEDCGNEGFSGNIVCECGNVREYGHPVPATGEHSDAAGDGDHLCDVCQTADISEHSGGKATCVEPAVCAECGQAYGNLAPEVHTGDTVLKGAEPATEEKAGYTGDVHCADCDALLEKGETIPKLEPEEPSEPTVPSEPEEDEDEPTEPTVPSEPEEDEDEPTEPTVPSEPEEDEDEPTEPTVPSEPEEDEDEPSVPTVPSEPEEDEDEPSEPTVPSEPEEEPTQPSEPEEEDPNPDTGDQLWLYLVMLMTSATMIPAYKRRK